MKNIDISVAAFMQFIPSNYNPTKGAYWLQRGKLLIKEAVIT